MTTVKNFSVHFLLILTQTFSAGVITRTYACVRVSPGGKGLGGINALAEMSDTLAGGDSARAQDTGSSLSVSVVCSKDWVSVKCKKDCAKYGNLKLVAPDTLNKKTVNSQALYGGIACGIG
jgi:hypothetical protein